MSHFSAVFGREFSTGLGGGPGRAFLACYPFPPLFIRYTVPSGVVIEFDGIFYP
jgi:hypothetical protein